MLPGKKHTPEELLQILRRRIWVLLVPFAVVSAGTAVVARRLPNFYRSETVVLVSPQRVPEAYVKSTVTSKVEDRLQVIEQQIMSRTHLEQIIRDFNLYADERKSGIMQDVVEHMRHDIDVQPLKGDGVRVSYVGRDPQTVMKVTAGLATLFIDENLRDRTNMAQGTNHFLETQLDDARRRLQDQEKKLEAYRLRHSGELPTQLQSNMEALHNLQLQIQATVETMNRQSQQKLMIEHELAGLRADALVPDPAVTPPAGGANGDPAPSPVATTAQQLALQQNLLKTLQSQGKTANHPDVISTKRQIADLTRKLEAEALEKPVSVIETANLSPVEKMRRKRMDDLQADLDQVNRQISYNQDEEKKLRAVAATYQQKIDAVPARETEMVELTRDYTTLQQLYMSLNQKNEESKIAGNLEQGQIGEQFNLLDAARLPEKPFKPNRPLINLIAMGVGLGLGLGLIVLLEYRDTSFKTDDEITGLLGLPVLAVVPLMQSDREKRGLNRRRILVGFGLGSTVVGCLAVLVYTFVR